jgi:hypothetical protein
LKLDPAEQQTTLKRLADEQGVKPVKNFEKFLEEIGDAWPEAESVDEFIAAIREQRRVGLRRDHR